MAFRFSGFRDGAMDWGFGGIEIKREVANPATRIPAIIFPVDVPEI